MKVRERERERERERSQTLKSSRIASKQEKAIEREHGGACPSSGWPARLTKFPFWPTTGWHGSFVF
jgi:hypothetical protein